MVILSLAAAERRRGVGRNFSVVKRPYVYVHVKWKDVTAGKFARRAGRVVNGLAVRPSPRHSGEGRDLAGALIR